MSQKEQFWIRMMDKLNKSSDLYQPIPEILCELCTFFAFGCGFIYQANHTGTFFLRERYSFYKSALQDTLDLRFELGGELAKELSTVGVVSFRQRTMETPLQKALAHLFMAKSMVLIPITDQHGRVIAFVGIADRRADGRVLEEDLQFTHSVLGVLANHVKLELYQARVEATQKSLESIMDNMGVDIYVNDFYTHEILYANKSMAAPYGGVENLVGKMCWQALYDDKTRQCDYCPQHKLIDENGNPTRIYSWDYQRPFDGAWFRVLSAAFRWVDGRLAHVVSSVDITENKINEEIIRKMAEYDNLTGLPNRRKFSQDCEELLPRLERHGGEGYVLFFDLDGFKQVNDSLGHHKGDELLIQIGQALEANPLTQNRIYRHGGDEFVLLCMEYSLDKVMETIGFLRERFSLPWNLSGDSVICQCSVGVSHFPRDAKRAADLLRCADIAMYAAKRTEDGSTRFYNKGVICTCQEYRPQ